ncbi:MAG: YncE family protein [Actinomycetota bacterium]
MSIRGRIAGWAAMVMVACGSAASHEQKPPSQDLLWIDTGSGLASLEAATGRVRVNAPQAVAAPDFSEVFSYSSDGADTTLVRRESARGTELSRMTFPGEFVANVVSGSEGLVALTEPRAPGATPWMPDGRSLTTVVVADPSAGTEKRYELKGNFEPEAFSTNNRRLYTIEYIPAAAPNRYRVRILNLGNGRVSPIGRLKLAAPGQMRGTGRMQVLSPGGHELYTLYTQQGPNYAHGGPVDHNPGATHAFIHLLNLAEGWAHCIDLPMPFGMGTATASAVAISPDGDHLYVVDWTNGAVAVVKPARLRVTRTVSVALGAADDQTFATASDDGTLYVAGNDQVVAMEATSLEVLNRWQLPNEVVGLAVASDGNRLYAALADRVVVLDASSREMVGTIPAEQVESIVHTVRIGDDA